MLGYPESMPFDSVKVIDQSTYTERTQEFVPTDPIGFFPFVSPRGVGLDQKLVYLNSSTIGNYGKPNLDKWGLSLYLPNQYLTGGGTVLGMRVVADDAVLANKMITASTIVIDEHPYLNDAGEQLYKNTTTGVISTDPTGGTAIKRKVVEVTFAEESMSEYQGTALSTPEDIEAALNSLYTTDTTTVFPLFAIYSRASGDFANNFKFRMAFDNAMEPENDQRFYKFIASENGSQLGETMSFTFDDEYIDNGVSMNPVDVFDTYSQYFGFVKSQYFDSFMALIGTDGLNTNKAETIDDIDILFGLSKDGEYHYNYVINPLSVSLSASEGLSLEKGSMGNFAVSAEVTVAQAAVNINKKLAKAYRGEITDLIYDEARYPFIHIFNPSDDIEVVTACIDLMGNRNTTGGPISITPTKTYAQARSTKTSNFGIVNSFKAPIYCESAMVLDPFTGKMTRMPSSYFNARAWAKQAVNGGDAIPFAGDYFKWEGFKAGTMQPQSTSSDAYIANHNVRINTMIEDGNGFATSYEELTSQAKMSKLSDIHNVQILLRMIRIALRIAKDAKWSVNSDEYISSYGKMVQDAIALVLKGSYQRLRVVAERESVNGAGRNRIHCKLEVLFNDTLKGVSYEFYII